MNTSLFFKNISLPHLGGTSPYLFTKKLKETLTCPPIFPVPPTTLADVTMSDVHRAPEEANLGKRDDKGACRQLTRSCWDPTWPKSRWARGWHMLRHPGRGPWALWAPTSLP